MSHVTENTKRLPKLPKPSAWGIYWLSPFSLVGSTVA
jgi:hypothetical protein